MGHPGNLPSGREAEIDVAILRDAGDEWRIVFAAELGHSRQSLNQHHRHLGTAVVAGTEVKLPYMVAKHSRLFQFVEADSLVFGYEQPALFPDKWQPDGVLCSRSEMRFMTFVLHAVLTERVEDGFAVVKIFVEVQNEVFRQRLPLSAPSGLLLRSAAA